MDHGDATRMRVVIIGAGFGGIGLGIKLKAAGMHDFIILEKSTQVGGVWRENRYPGAECDIPSHLYSFSFRCVGRLATDLCQPSRYSRLSDTMCPQTWA